VDKPGLRPVRLGGWFRLSSAMFPAYEFDVKLSFSILVVPRQLDEKCLLRLSRVELSNHHLVTLKMPTTSGDRRPVKSRSWKTSQAAAGWLASRNASPNGISVAGTSPHCLANQWQVMNWALWLILLGSLLTCGRRLWRIVRVLQSPSLENKP
jgi:hypothetical protein